MDSSAPGTVTAIDGFRAAAATLVIVYHSWLLTGRAPLDHGPLRAILSGGTAGVDLFFVLSGFVLFLPIARRGGVGSVPEYARRRVARIVPAYYLCLLAVVTLYPWIAVVHAPMPWHSTSGVTTLIAHMAFVHVPLYGLSLRTGFGIDQVLWTISLEAMFYVALPIISGSFLQRPRVWLVGSICVAMASSIAATVIARHNDQLATYWGVQFPAYAGHFALGMGAALFFARARERQVARIARWAPFGQAASLAAVCALMATLGSAELGSNRTYRFMIHPLLGLAFGALVLITVTASPNGPRALVNRVTVFVGAVSYGMYLFHDLIIGYALRHGLHASATTGAFLRMAVVAVAAATVLGYLSFRLLEQPLRRWARTGSRGRQDEALDRMPSSLR